MKVINLTKKYNDEYVFKNINCSFTKGKIYSIFGKNGVGKTTLLKIIANQISNSDGEVQLDSNNIMYISDFLFPFKYMTGLEYVDYTLKMKNRKVTIDTIKEKFLMLGLLENDMNKMVEKYSKGMRYKLIIILFMLIEPEILLLDEPFVDVDIVTLELVKSVFEEYKKNKIIILTTHIIDIACLLSDEILFLKQDGLEELKGNDIKNLLLDKMSE